MGETPRSPREDVSGELSSLRAATSFTCSACPSRSTPRMTSLPPLVSIARRNSSKVETALPLTDVMRSPTRTPASTAGIPGSSNMTREEVRSGKWVVASMACGKPR